MKDEQSSTYKHPREEANFLNRLCFWWTYDTFKKGSNGTLQMSDIYMPPLTDDSELLCNKLEHEWNRELALVKTGKGSKKPFQRQPSFARAMMRVFFWENVWIGISLTLQNFLRLSLPFFQDKIIDRYSMKATQSEATLNAIFLIVITLIVPLIWQHYFLGSQELGIKYRVACTSLIYRKLLRIDKSSLSGAAGGRVMALIGPDLTRFEYLVTYGHWAYCSILQLILLTYLMWNRAGYAALVGIGCVIVISIPINILVAIFTSIHTRKTSVLTDRRIQLMNELLAGIQVVKMYAWEVPFSKMVSEVRAEEVKQIRYASYLKALYLGVTMLMGRFILFICVVAYSLMGHSLSPNVTFSLSTYLYILQVTVGMRLPQALLVLAECMTSVKRLEEFLLLKEIDESSIQVVGRGTTLEEASGKRVEIEFSRVYASWVEGQLPPTLFKVDLKVKSGELCAIVGAVGSGKSAILNVILRELSVASGHVFLRTRPSATEYCGKGHYITDDPSLTVSYASQDAWLFSGTVRDNILFGQPYEEERYMEVTTVCALRRDFQQFPRGDMSLVGERGVALSGGQKARINLARAVYKRADIYLLDDPLSAVDSRVGQHVFQQCIVNLLTNKTRILVTHQLQFVARVDTIAIMDHGSVVGQGTYEGLGNSNVDFMRMLKNRYESGEALDLAPKSSKRRSSNMYRRHSQKVSKPTETSECEDVPEAAPTEQEEKFNRGAIEWRTYKIYFTAAKSRSLLILIILGVVLFPLSNCVFDYWTTFWTRMESMKAAVQSGHVAKTVYARAANDTHMKLFGLDSNGYLLRDNFIYVYIFLILAVACCNFTLSFSFMANCTKTSYNMHNTIFQNVMRATMGFLNANHSGRILNRFSKDMSIIDQVLPKFYLESILTGLLILGIISIESITNYWLMIVVAALVVVILALRRMTVNTISLLKRFEGISKSPIFSHANTTMNGLTTIRSGGRRVEEMMRNKFDVYQNCHTGCDHIIKATMTMFCLCIDMSVSLFIASIVLFATFMNTDSSSASTVGLAISHGLTLARLMQFSLRQGVEVVIQMGAVERIEEYADLPQEITLASSGQVPPNWPSEGRVTLRNVNMRYRMSEPLVLKDLNLTIESGWKVGIVGRTGAGKSSLISALFRLTGEGLEGSVVIDGRDTATVGLSDLRSRISIIPQVPVLFSKSLRYNLDPFNHFPDSALLKAIEDVQLSNVSLDQEISEDGSNFSVGQRQLICLARAILRDNKILVLDEATANIDNFTDSLIQKIIRKRFAKCTVLTIAHRLNTIIDSDRIIVMNDGRVAEYDSPYELLCNKPNGHFSKMIKQLGPLMTEELLRQAELAHTRSLEQNSDVLEET